MNKRYSRFWQTIRKKGAEIKLIKKFIKNNLRFVFQVLSSHNSI